MSGQKAKTPDTSSNLTGWTAWRSALLHTLPVAALVLYLFYYWFAIADRYVIFLYWHYMGPHYPDTSPFSVVTSSHYWMAGLVASGTVMAFYMVVGFVT